MEAGNEQPQDGLSVYSQFIATFVILITLFVLRGGGDDPNVFGAMVFRLAVLLYVLQLLVRGVWAFCLGIRGVRAKKTRN